MVDRVGDKVLDLAIQRVDHVLGYRKTRVRVGAVRVDGRLELVEVTRRTASWLLLIALTMSANVTGAGGAGFMGASDIKIQNPKST